MRDFRRIVRTDSPSSGGGDAGRALAGYAILGTALLSSPLLLPLVLALLMVGLHGTPVGSALLARLHVVYIGLAVYCLAALAAAAYLLRRSAPDLPERRDPPVPARVPDARYLEFQRWLVAHGRHADDALQPGENAYDVLADPLRPARAGSAGSPEVATACRPRPLGRIGRTPMAITFDGAGASPARLPAATPGGARLLALGAGHLAALRDRGLGLAALFASAVEISRAVERAPSNRRRELGSAWMWTELGGNG